MRKYNRVLFIGSKAGGLNVLREIYTSLGDILIGCVTVDDAVDTRSELSRFRKYCDENDISLIVLEGKCDLTDVIREYVPDLCVVMGWYYIIPERVIESVEGGFIGIHNSLLPAHRGFAPVVWSMIDGEKETGFSVFSFDNDMDTGNIWYQEKIEIKDGDYVADVLKRIDIRIGLFFRERFKKLVCGEMNAFKQSNTGISYGARRTRDDGRIDWNLDAKRVYNFIRAQSKPYPGAFAYLGDQKVTIYTSDVFPYKIQGKPGQIGIFDRNRQMVVIVCGNSTGLIVSRVELDGKLIPLHEMIYGLDQRFV